MVFQLYVWNDRALSHALVDRARACEVQTLVVTADTPIGPIREYNVRNGFGMPFRWSTRAMLDIAFRPGWVWRVLAPSLLRGGMPEYGHYPPEARPTLTRAVHDDRVGLASRLSWDDLRTLRRRWPGQIVIKGILHADDARLAAEAGMDGIVVSAHGGRNLDCAIAPTEALPPIVDAVGHRMTILADGGVRRGSDVLKYLSLGAKAAMAGRLPLWGLAADDEAGANSALATLIAELHTTSHLLGIHRPNDIRDTS